MFDFPLSPILGQQYTEGDRTWEWNGFAWVLLVEVGTQGSQGPQGTQGFQGFQGVAGSNGTQGPQGNQGFQGVVGSNGTQGPQGDQGFQGFQGVAGSNGTQGPQGFQGVSGTQGFQGVAGTQGPQGDQGFQGFQGVAGSNGTQGPQGFQGTQGPQGGGGGTGYTYSDTAPVSPNIGDEWTDSSDPALPTYRWIDDGDTTQWVELGTPGETGPQGTQGPQGFQGVAGSNGTQGPQGFQGVPGNFIRICIAASDETTAITAGTNKVRFRMPTAMTLTQVRATVNTAPTGSTIIVDINEGDTPVSILSTKISIDVGEFSSVTAAAAPVISDTSLADDALISIDFDQVGSTVAGAGLKVWLIGT
jgi:hypothetical protein